MSKIDTSWLRTSLMHHIKRVHKDAHIDRHLNVVWTHSNGVRMRYKIQPRVVRLERRVECDPPRWMRIKSYSHKEAAEALAVQNRLG